MKLNYCESFIAINTPSLLFRLRLARRRRVGKWGSQIGEVAGATCRRSEAALGNLQSVVHDFVHQSMFLGNAPRPVAPQLAFEQFRLAGASKGRSDAFFQQVVDFARYNLISPLPEEIVLPGCLVPA